MATNATYYKGLKQIAMMASEKLNETPDGFYEEGSPVAADLSPFFPPIRHRVRGQICTPKHSIGGELEVRLRHALDGPLLPEAQLRAIARGGDVVQGSGFGAARVRKLPAHPDRRVLVEVSVPYLEIAARGRWRHQTVG